MPASECQQISDLRVGATLLPLNPLKGTSDCIHIKIYQEFDYY